MSDRVLFAADNNICSYGTKWKMLQCIGSVCDMTVISGFKMMLMRIE